MPHCRRRHAAALVAAEVAAATSGKHDGAPGAIDRLAALTGTLDDGSGKRLKLCWFYAHGKCTKGHNCSFVHAALQASEAAERQPPEQRLQPSREEADIRGAAGKRPQQAVVELAGALPASLALRQSPSADRCGVCTMAAPGAPDAGVTTAFAHAALQHVQAAMTLWNIAEMVRVTTSAASMSAPTSFAGADSFVPVGYEPAWPGWVGQGYPQPAQAAPQRVECQDAELAFWDHAAAQCAGGHLGVPCLSGKIAADAQRPVIKPADLSPDAASSALSTAGSGASEVDVADSSSDDDSEAEGLLVVKNTFLTIELAEGAPRPLRRVGSAPALVGAGARGVDDWRASGPACRSSSFENLRRVACGR
jgi:hypothetical protein